MAHKGNHQTEESENCRTKEETRTPVVMVECCSVEEKHIREVKEECCMGAATHTREETAEGVADLPAAGAKLAVKE
jgi:hypothetical protein